MSLAKSKAATMGAFRKKWHKASKISWSMYSRSCWKMIVTMKAAEDDIMPTSCGKLCNQIFRYAVYSTAGFMAKFCFRVVSVPLRLLKVKLTVSVRPRFLTNCFGSSNIWVLCQSFFKIFVLWFLRYRKFLVRLVRRCVLVYLCEVDNTDAVSVQHSTSPN